jgi:hypothetical protein
MAVRGGEAFQVRDRFNIPNDDVIHPQCSAKIRCKAHS